MVGTGLVFVETFLNKAAKPLRSVSQHNLFPNRKVATGLLVALLETVLIVFHVNETNEYAKIAALLIPLVVAYLVPERPVTHYAEGEPPE